MFTIPIPLLHGALKLFQQLFLFAPQINGGLHFHLTDQVANATTMHRFNTFAT